MKIALMAGHSCASEGAAVCAGFYKGYGEHRLALEYLPALGAELERHRYNVVFTQRAAAGGTSPRYSAMAANAAGADIALEWHFNAADSSTGGCEVLYWGGSEHGKKFAELLAGSLAGILKVRNRGAKPVRSAADRGYEAFRRSRMPFFMVEPCFAGSNAEEAQKFCELVRSGYFAVAAGNAVAEVLAAVYVGEQKLLG